MIREHGTARGYNQHRRLGEATCDDCRRAWRDYVAEHRPKPAALKPCGTEAAYRRHLRHGETPCEACVAAATKAGAARRAKWSWR